MNRAPTRHLLCSLTAAVIVAAAADAAAFPNPFKKKEPTAAPAAPELRMAEIEAGDLLRQAQDAEAAGKSGAAASSYKRVVDRYPLTSFAPMAMFRLASTYEREGKFSKAFETYQELVDTYKQSAQFSESIDRQIAIATQSRTEKLGSFMGIPKKLDRSEQIDMFQKVISNAPRGRRAAEAQFEIAKIHEEEDETDLAITAYKKVVEDYPASPLAADAQTKVSKKLIGKFEDGSRDTSNIERARAAADQASGLFPDMSTSALSETRAKVDEITAENAWKTGKFYEKQGNYRAALVYYSDVLRAPGSPHFSEARERINDMTAKDSKLVGAVPAVAVTAKDLAVPAAVDVKGKPGYFGPPPPPVRLASAIRKPKMRSGGSDQIPITPLEEPDLPTSSGRLLKPDDSLLNPGSSTPAPVAPGPGDLVPGDTLPAPGTSLEPALPQPEMPTLPPPSEPVLPAPTEPVVPAPDVPVKPTN